jgi:peptide/nickel transport system substrate-binding protein
MIRRRDLLGAPLLLAAPRLAFGQAALIEPPPLEAEVRAGRLPPVAERMPENPMRHGAGRADVTPGRHGGELRMLLGRPQDIRMLSVYGYARLVMLTPDYRLIPDILEDVQAEDESVFTLKLRRGHRWSDGHQLTSEDFRYWWEDVANNRALAPAGLPAALLVDGRPPQVFFPDALTVRYAWAGRNPYFLMALCGPAPIYIFRPAHYLRQFHQRYADRAQLQEIVRQRGARNWGQLHNRLDNMNRNDNPDLPTLEPWIPRTRPPSDRFVFERNPYFHRVDQEGRQLPYIDRVVANIADGRLIPAKTGAGESHLQARNIAFSNYTFLRQAARRNALDVRLWRTAKGAHLALYPNLNARDEQWKRLNRDVRFRRALSFAINRREINQVVYFGLASEGQNTVLPDTPLYRQENHNAYARFDPVEANRLLDTLGLTERDARGVRKLPDGRPMELIVETAGEDTEQTDVLELIHDSWMGAGIKLFSRPLQREVFRNRLFAGQTVMAIWGGLENGRPTPMMSPEELAPVRQDQVQWPRWGQHAETKGSSGEPIDDPEAQRLFDLNRQWRQAGNEAARAEVWRAMLAIHAEQLFTIGIVAGVRQPVVVSNRLRNVPAEGIYNWDPGAFFGVYRPDLFWFAEA